ncbi:Aste57867_18529 [Aphanomyces stellatus]|uniref:Aste57867_18529 protein n=1 Tax=Aphanomyces stellatus TaxID=120398 RepID=A0A485LBU2_9STRA|nr:hypothetical protein As57867_018467 [Aphanomyces stellatus]VFT95265.1 Aste57867_18529 [Aphanomyces stellatus]
MTMDALVQQAQDNERHSISAPGGSLATVQQSARLVARSWNFRAKNRLKFNMANIDRPLTEGDTPYNYESTFTQSVPRSASLFPTPERRHSNARRSGIGLVPLQDHDCTYDELFEREVVQIPPRLELTSQAAELQKLIAKAEAASDAASSHKPAMKQPAPGLPVMKRHTSLIRLLAKEPIEPATASAAALPTVEEADEQQHEPLASEAHMQDTAHMVAKFQCLMNRDVNFVHVLPQPNNHPLTSLVDDAWKIYRDGRYSDCLRQLKKCCIMNTEAANRPTLFFNIAVVLAHLGEFDDAMVELNEAIKLDPEVARYFKLRSVLWRIQEKYIEASKDSKRAANIEHSKAGHKHVHQLARKALKAIAIVKAEVKVHHVATKQDLFEDAYETTPSQRSRAQIELLVDQSNRIPCLAKLQQDMLHALWRNLSFDVWPKDTITYVAKSTVSVYIVLEGTITVQTDTSGVRAVQQTLEPGSIFSEGTISVNLWGETLLEAMTACRVLTLEGAVYKHTLKKVMMDGACRRADFFTSTGIFADWTEEQRNTLGILSENLEFGAGNVVVLEGTSDAPRSLCKDRVGTPATHLYFVQAGLCGAMRQLGSTDGSTRIQVATLSSGDVFGEAAVLDPINGKFPLTIVANTICKLVRIEKNYLNKHNAFELLRLGPMSSSIMAKIHRFSVRCPQDKLLVQMIRDNCKWKLERKKVLKEFAKDMAKAHGKLSSLPRVQSEPTLPTTSKGI